MLCVFYIRRITTNIQGITYIFSKLPDWILRRCKDFTRLWRTAGHYVIYKWKFISFPDNKSGKWGCIFHSVARIRHRRQTMKYRKTMVFTYFQCGYASCCRQQATHTRTESIYVPLQCYFIRTYISSFVAHGGWFIFKLNNNNWLRTVAIISLAFFILPTQNNICIYML